MLALLALPASAADLRDVPEGFWAGEEIVTCVERGLFETKDGVFGVGEPMERGAFLVALGRLFGWEEEGAGDLPYDDVPEDARYAGAVAAAYRRGVVTEQVDALRPEEPITREELAVTLVRALGYRSIAGLAGGIPTPFRDVTTNTGYVTVAYDLGLMNGNNGLFSPDSQATREQTAAVLARLYAYLRRDAPALTAIVSSAEDLEGRQGLTVVAVRAGRLLEGKKATLDITLKGAEAIRDAAREAGARALLYVSGSSLSGGAAELLSETVRSRGYDGLFLSLSGRVEPSRVRELKEGLGDGLLYLNLDAPSWEGGSPYDYGALGEAADRLVLNIAAPERMIEGFPASPLEPPEELYYALRTLRGQVEAEKLSVLVSTSGSIWNGDRRGGAISGTGVQALLEREEVTAYYSERYACAWLRIPLARSGQEERVVWYLDERAAAGRVRLLRLFGVDQVCLSDLSGVSEELLRGLATEFG